MKASILRGLAVLLLWSALPRAQAVTYTSADLFVPGNNAFNYIIFPAPGEIIIKTDAEIKQAVTTVQFPVGSLNNSAGITVLVQSHLPSIASHLNALGLKVGDPFLAQYANVFTDVFGIYSPNTFGFADSSLLTGFGVVGSPIYFGLDNGSENGMAVVRYLTRGNDEARFAYYSNPLIQQVPDSGGALPLLAAVLGCLAAVHRRCRDRGGPRGNRCGTD